MKKFMVVCKSEGKQWAAFFDTQGDAEEYRMNAECGVGALAEVYQYMDQTAEEVGGYEFMYS